MITAPPATVVPAPRRDLLRALTFAAGLVAIAHGLSAGLSQIGGCVTRGLGSLLGLS